MKYTFNSTTYALINTVGEEVWVQGDNNTKVMKFYFTDSEDVSSYECRAIIKRANGDQSNEIYCSPINTGSEQYYKLAIKGWISDYSGTVEITIRRKKYNTVTDEYDIITYGLITKDVTSGVLPDESNTISEEQYLFLLTEISQMKDGLITYLGVDPDFDDVVISGLYWFKGGLLFVKTYGDITRQYKLVIDETLSNLKFVLHRELTNGVWTEWVDTVDIDLLKTKQAIIEVLNVDDVFADSVKTSYLETVNAKIGKILGDLDIDGNLIVRGVSEFRNEVSFGAGVGFEQSPVSYDIPTLNAHLTPKKYVDDEIDNHIAGLTNDLEIGIVKVSEAYTADYSLKARADRNNKLIDTHYATKGELTEHNENQSAHVSIRQEIDEVRQDLARTEGRGKSYGELNYTQSELESMSLSERNNAILVDIQGSHPSYSPSNGDLVYTKEVPEENTHEWEYNSVLGVWVDNGAYTVQRATNDIFGIVKGGNGYVNILNGLIEVIKSDYATRVGTDLENGYTFEELNNLITTILDDIADRYTKGETYSKIEVDFIINQLKAIYGWEDSLIIEKTFSVLDSEHVAQTLLLEYDFVLATIESGSRVSSVLFEPRKYETISSKIFLQALDDVNVVIAKDGLGQYIMSHDTSSATHTFRLTGIKMANLELLHDIQDQVEVVEKDIKDIINGDITVAKSHLAEAIVGVPLSVEDVFKDRVTAKDINEIGNTAGEIKAIGGQTIKQVLENASEVEVLSTEVTYSHNCISGNTYYVSIDTNKTGLKVTNGTQEVLMPNGYAKFVANSNSEYYIDYVKDGVNKVSKAQWFELDSQLKLKTADELRVMLGNKFYQFGLTDSVINKFVSVGDNLWDWEYFYNTLKAVNSSNINIVNKDGRRCIEIKRPDLYDGVELYKGKFSPNVQYKMNVEAMIPQVNNGIVLNFKYLDASDSLSFRILDGNNKWLYNEFVSLNKTIDSIICRTSDYTATTYINIDKLQLTHTSNPITEYVPYKEEVINIPEFIGASLPNGIRDEVYPEIGVKITRVGEKFENGVPVKYELENPIPTTFPKFDYTFSAKNYGRESLNDVAFTKINYYRDPVKQVDTNTDLIESLLLRVQALESK